MAQILKLTFNVALPELQCGVEAQRIVVYQVHSSQESFLSSP